MTRSGSQTRSGVRVRSTGLPRFARNDAKRQSGAKRSIREATVRRKAKRTRSPEGATRPHPDASASGHNTLRAKRSNTLWASPPHTFRASASEAKRQSCRRFASSRGTKRSRRQAFLCKIAPRYCWPRLIAGLWYGRLHSSITASPLDCFVVPPRNDAKRQSGAKRRIREAAARRKATQTRTYLGFAPTHASRHCEARSNPDDEHTKQ